eukprot:gnl/TRDRNA2_/TRDRNA2_46053_c1_seq1.p1 gnl/TRDRNA2_/TRDRNA2_46053_c1~~gnl/TRDRNA2_/TRDRNA2_46053_c1_seq1.p1  ORF type:complete len:233 (+),score=26.62 gnl/TRDRNA2_/TRDRNA2_46053_c1_seq1:101-700(+)
MNGSVSITMPNNGKEKNRKAYWCHAKSAGSMHAGSQTWKFRIDHIPPSSHGAWIMVFSVVSGPDPALHLHRGGEECFVYRYDEGAHLILRGEHDSENYFWKVSVKNSTEDFVVEGGAVGQNVRRGDMISIRTRFGDLQQQGDIEWRLNDALIDKLQNQLVPKACSACVDLYKWNYEFETIGATILEHTVDCRGACSSPM